MGFWRFLKSQFTEKVCLEFIEIEQVPKGIKLYQASDGIIYFHSDRNPSRIYVKWRGNVIEAELPIDASRIDVHKGAIYFYGERKFYKATFSPSKGITVVFVRNQLEDEEVIHEEVDRGVLCRRQRDGQQYIYRMSDNPERGGVLVDATDEKLRSKTPIAIHRNKIIYTDDHYWPTLTKMSENSVCLAMLIQHDELTLTTFSDDSTPFFYTSDVSAMTVLNTKTMSILPTLHTPENLCIEIAGVHKGFLTVVGSKIDEDDEMTDYIMVAQLPQGFYKAIASEDDEDGSAVVKKQFGEIQLREPEDEDSFTSEFQAKFIIESVLGQGGFGCVFGAKNRLDKWTYAVKRIPLKGRPDDIRSAMAEVQTMASFDHPGIVRYNHCWKEEPPAGWQRWSDNELSYLLNYKGHFNYKNDCAFLYIQMELCKYTLAEWLYNNSHRELDQMKAWFKQIVAAVAYIHKKRIIHRDLKPSNILFAGPDRLKICDLGIVAESAIENGQEVPVERSIDRGTAMYMAPEQGWFDYSSKVEIFTLGLILVEMCVVMSMYEAQEVFAVYRSGETPNTLNDLPEVEEIVCLLTRHEEADRPNCKEILNHPFLANVQLDSSIDDRRGILETPRTRNIAFAHAATQ